MKIRYKILITMILIICVFVASTIFIVLRLFTDNVTKDKVNLSTALSKQILFSFDLLSDDIEYYLFDNIYNKKVPQTLYSDEGLGLKAVKINYTLQIIRTNNPYLEGLFVIDNDTNIFYSLDDTLANQYSYYHSTIQQGFFDTEKDTAWLRDDNGNIYLRKAVYNLSPYEKTGYVVAVINSEFLDTVIGINTVLLGNICIYNNNNQIISSDNEYESVLSEIAFSIQQISNSDDFKDTTIYIDNIDYRVIKQSTQKNDWFILNIIDNSEFLALTKDVTNFSIYVGIILAIFSIFLSYIFSRSMTRNIQSLINCMDDIGQGNYDIILPPISRDEIGVLTKDFGLMLDRIKELNHQMIADAKIQQQAKYDILELKYRALQTQISPHFICNILSSLNSYSIVGDVKKVESLAILASQYLRKNLKSNDNKFTSVQIEFQTVKNYIKLFRSIFATNFVYIAKSETKVKHMKIPNLILQPLVENSLKYGQNCHHKLRILLNAKEDDNRLVITLEDNGMGFDSSTINKIQSLESGTSQVTEQGGFGLESVLQRLKLLYANNFSFNIQSEEGNNSKITIILPLEKFNKGED